MRDDLFTDCVVENVDAGRAHELEIFTDCIQGFIRVAMGTQKVLEGAVFFFQFKDFLRWQRQSSMTWIN